MTDQRKEVESPFVPPAEEFGGYEVAAENERSIREQPLLGQSLAALAGLLRGFPLTYPVSSALEKSGPDALARARTSYPATYYSSLAAASAPALALGPVGAAWPAYLTYTDPNFQRWYGDGKREFERRVAPKLID